MARAGFYAIQNSQIRFGRDGRWYADGQPIENLRIADLFSRHVSRRPDGQGYQLQIGDERAPIEVDDTPYVVIGVDARSDGTLRIELNDHSVEPLALGSLTVGTDAVLHCQVKGGTEPARFLRSAYYQLAPLIAETASGFQLTVGGRAYPIADT